jgi:hypothetical protein
MYPNNISQERKMDNIYLNESSQEKNINYISQKSLANQNINSNIQ